MICFAKSGSAIGTRAAKAVADELLRKGIDAALYRCLRASSSAGSKPLAQIDADRASVCGRQFLEDTRRLRSSHEHLLVDLCDASDQIAAIAFASADLILVPFLPHEADAEPFLRTIELLEILSAHRPQPLRHAVFLAASERIGPGLHLEISGQLIRRGILTLSVPFRERRRAQGGGTGYGRPPAELGNNGSLTIEVSEIARFADCALDMAHRPCQPTVPRTMATG